MRDSDRVTFLIGGGFSKHFIPEFLKIVYEQVPTYRTELKKTILKILRNQHHIDSDSFCIGSENSYLWVYFVGIYRFQNLEDFCVKHGLPFIAYGQLVTDTIDGGDTSDYHRYEWEPGFEDVNQISTCADFTETTSKEKLDNFLKAARDCRDFNSLPTKLNSKSCYTVDFAQRCLKGESVLDILISSIEGMFEKEISLPFFKFEET